MARQVSRRHFLAGTAAATGALAAPQILKPSAAFGQSLPDPDKVLAEIKPGNYVKQDYLEQFGIGPDDELWDPNKDWIRIVDWEKIRSQFAGETTRFAVGAADAQSVSERLEPFRQLSGMDVEVVPIPDDSLFDKAMTDFKSGAGRFDAIQYFSPYLGDFAAPGYLTALDEYVEKWNYPLSDFADTYRLNYAYFGDKVYGIPYDCDIQMVHVRNSVFEDVTGSRAGLADTLQTYDDVLKYAKQLHKPDQGHSGVAMMTQRGFWATYTWQHIAAQYGFDMFDSDWEPQVDSEASVKAVEMMLALQKNAPTGVTGWGWPENRSAWLAGQTAMNIAWQDQGNQATRPDQSSIAGDDVTTVFEPRGTGPNARFAPPNIAGSTSSVSTHAKNPEAGFLVLAFFTTASLEAMNGANANGVGPGHKSVIGNPKFQKIMTAADVWYKSLGHSWCAPRIPGALSIDISIGNQLNAIMTGNKPVKEGLQEAQRRARAVMERNRFYTDNPPVEYTKVEPGLYLGKDKPLPF
jgi:multiple sugar transport system substrate-binding protein